MCFVIGAGADDDCGCHTVTGHPGKHEILLLGSFEQAQALLLCADAMVVCATFGRMALWGPININEQTIGTWTATREEQVDAGPTYRYACEVTIHMTRRQFYVTHNYGHGAVALAATVLTHADSLMRTEHEQRRR